MNYEYSLLLENRGSILYSSIQAMSIISLIEKHSNSGLNSERGAGPSAQLLTSGGSGSGRPVRSQ